MVEETFKRDEDEEEDLGMPVRDPTLESPS